MSLSNSKKIKLFITDIDGCLLNAMQTPDWNVLQEIKSLNEQSHSNDLIPALTICTGRPMPYAEAVAQWMDIKLPIVFENAGLFHLEGYRISVDGSFNKSVEKNISKLKKWLTDEIIQQYEGMTLEFAKLMDAGLIHPEKEVIQEALPEIQEHVAENYEGFEVHWTDISINIILKKNNKKSGIKKLCKLQDMQPEEVAYIGDSSGDVPGLEIVGRPFAPQNAKEEVKKVARELPGQSTEAVLQAYKMIIEENSNGRQ